MTDTHLSASRETHLDAHRDPAGAPTGRRAGSIKCVVWDLDNTIWDGVLLEHGSTVPRPGVIQVIRTLDERGILHSIASRNEHAIAVKRLDALGIVDYFVYPQIGWNPKSSAIGVIAQRLNIGLDAIAFIDDQAFELGEVAHAHPQVMCVPASRIAALPDEPAFMPRFITEESRQRRHLYRNGVEREAAEEAFTGSPHEFLATLKMVFTISEATVDDLRRAEELTIRTNQLNSTGLTYSYAELEGLTRSADHLLLIASLSDRFGSYGTIGLALIGGPGVRAAWRRSAVGSVVGEGRRPPGAAAQHSPAFPPVGDPPTWTLALLLMSCRVMSRGVGAIMLNHVVGLARHCGARLTAEFIHTGRNRIMYVTYRFAGFEEVTERDGIVLLQAPTTPVPEPPAYVQVLLRRIEQTNAGQDQVERTDDE